MNTDWNSPENRVLRFPICPESGKLGYKSQAKARRAMTRSSHYWKKMGSENPGVYYCGACNLWHITRNNKYGKRKASE